MTELAKIEKAIEEQQARIQGLFDEQKKEISSTGEISKKLQDDFIKLQEELKTSGTRLFDLESKLAAGNLDNPEHKKSFAARASLRRARMASSQARRGPP